VVKKEAYHPGGIYYQIGLRTHGRNVGLTPLLPRIV
jgi:hypothetical protein